MKKGSNLSILTRGILKENPVLVLILGTCPTLFVTDSVSKSVGMGLAVLVVLLCSTSLSRCCVTSSPAPCAFPAISSSSPAL